MRRFRRADRFIRQITQSSTKSANFPFLIPCMSSWMFPACTVSPANFMIAQLKVRSIHNELRFAKQPTQGVIAFLDFSFPKPGGDGCD